MTNSTSQKLRLIVATAMTLLCFMGLMQHYTSTALAQVDIGTPNNNQTTKNNGAPKVYNGNLKNNPIIKWIQFFVNLLAVVIIAGSVVMAAFAGLQYTSARDNAQTVQAAKERIINVIFGLVAFFFLYGFIQWLIPGGVF